MVVPVAYPSVEGVPRFDYASPLSRLLANYAEALRSNSPFYAFLCLFALVEFLTGPLQGRLRRLHRIAPIHFEDLAGKLSDEDVKHIGKYAAGTTFAELLEETRPARNAVAHFLMEVSFRPFDVVAEDRIAFRRDALKIAARRMLQIAENNARRFLMKGVTPKALVAVFEGRFESLSALANILSQRIALTESKDS